MRFMTTSIVLAVGGCIAAGAAGPARATTLPAAVLGVTGEAYPFISPIQKSGPGPQSISVGVGGAKARAQTTATNGILLRDSASGGPLFEGVEGDSSISYWFEAGSSDT